MTINQWNSTKKQIGLNESGDVLKPCPMCNGKAEMDFLNVVKDGEKFRRYFVKCIHCGMKTAAYDDVPDCAGIAWQFRYYESL